MVTESILCFSLETQSLYPFQSRPCKRGWLLLERPIFIVFVMLGVNWLVGWVRHLFQPYKIVCVQVFFCARMKSGPIFLNHRTHTGLGVNWRDVVEIYVYHVNRCVGLMGAPFEVTQKGFEWVLINKVQKRLAMV